MPSNVEIKAKVKDLPALIEAAKRLSQSDGQLIRQEDTFFRNPHGRLKLRSFEDQSAQLIYYDRPDAEGPKLSQYDKFDMPDGHGLLSVLTSALGTKGTVKKERQLFMVGQTRVHVDSVEGLGSFMELEVVLRDDQTAADGERIAYDLMEQLGVSQDDLVSGAYVDLLQNH